MFRKTVAFSKIFISFFLILNLFLTPAGIAFAQEALATDVTDTPSIETVSDSSSVDVVGTDFLIDSSITEESVVEPATDDEITEAPTQEETPKEEEPAEEQKIDPEMESMMMSSQPGPELNLGTSGIKSNLPEVDKINGALVFNYSLNIPPGRNGMQPDLKLVHNSQGGEDGKIFGDKWSLNLPYIERINRKGTDKFYTEDIFNSSIDGELIDLGSGVFRPKVENGQFIKYVYASSAWTAVDKKGNVYKFGTTSSSRLDNPSDSTKIYRWLIDDARDLNLNYIKYEYYKNGGEIYPATITYTGNNTTDGIFKVEFSRTSQSKPIVSARPGFTISATYHINEIAISIDNSWVRKYTLAYSNADNGQDYLLNTITETGRDESANTVSLPVEDYDYQVATTSGSSWSGPSWNAPADTTKGVIIADVNGDGLDDFIQAYFGGSTSTYQTWLNNGTGWTSTSDFVPPVLFNSNGTDQGVRAIDVNGDGLVDLVQSQNGPGATNATYINDGDGWNSSSNWVTTMGFIQTNNQSTDTGTRVGDFNGDGLPDLINGSSSPHFNNGTTGWTNSSWTNPVDVKDGVLIVDVNDDGLDDLVQAYDTNPDTIQTWLNNGQGWTSTSDFASPLLFMGYNHTDNGVRAIDVNGDGWVDLTQRVENGSPISYLNNGSGWTTTSYWDVPLNFITQSGADWGTRMGDFDGDGKIDFIDANNGEYGIGTSIFLHAKPKANLLSKITYPRGGYTEVVYQASPMYKTGSTYLNPNLPLNIVTVKSLTNNDGLGLSSSHEFKYEGGKYYYNTAHDRKFAGFSLITKTDAVGNKIKTYYHQGDSTNSSQGEYSDHYSKIGKIYRVEATDSSDNVYAKKISKWENYSLGSGRDFVKLTQTIDFTYDGDSDHRDKASTYTYNDANGNITEQIDWGEVTGADAGTYTDTGSDKYTTTVAYASNTTYNILGLAKQEVVTDQSSNKVRESKYYYDNQSYGDVNVGNLTKEERWKTSSTYIDFEKTYNTTYGIVTQDKDPRDKTTDYTYDSYYLYPATVTNALSQATTYTYDYSLGKPKQVTLPNTRVFQTVYDGLDRVVQEKQPDIATPSTLVTKTTYTYTDQTIGNKTQKTDSLDGSVTVDSYTYTDGFDRPIQTRKETEDSYSVSDTVYNNIEQVYKQSLPYISSGSSKTSATTTSSLLTTYSYDPIYRVTTTVNAAGTVTNAYDDWKLAVTDARSKVKNYYKDAYDNLIQVDEINSGSTYTTNYEYNGNKNLTKITDALSNIRNFTYDGLGRRLTSEDLHASGDSTFGSWSYTYDDAGNMTQSVSPESKTVNYTYDDINRILTENETVESGTEITYAYDSCTEGAGRLCTVTMTSGANTAYTYDANGNTASEVKTINSTAYTTSYTYDRQGNNLVITYPDSAQVRYTYNTAGLLNQIERKESGGSYTDVISNIDYSPTYNPTIIKYANGAMTTNTYDATNLYRLTNKRTSTYVNPDPSNTAPTITLTGAALINKNVGDSWSDPGYSASDAEDGSLTGSVSVTGSVNTATAGTYQLVYAVVDSDGAPAAKKIRTVVVHTVTYPTLYVKALVIGGGGGGGKGGGGGGGGGGYIQNDTLAIAQQAYTVTVGAGGAGSTNVNNNGSNGGNSSLGSAIVVDGGGGGSSQNGYSGSNGGSGGGSSHANAGGTATSGQGNNGATGHSNGSGGGGGGKGSAGSAGAGGIGSAGGAGGAGTSSSISGSAVTRGGGGGGGSAGTASGGSGAGGGGNGGNSVPTETVGANATANTGGGGGGGGGDNGVNGSMNGGNGGSGIVIVSYKTDGSDGVSTDSTGGTITTSGAYTIHTFTSSGTFTAVGVPITPPSNANPAITLTGSTLFNLNVGDTWTEPGYSATDAEDGTVTGSVSVTGSVDTATAGTYQLVYSVVDSGGLPAERKIRTIVVHALNFDLQDITYIYDANSNITQIVDASDTNTSKTVAYTYDDLNRMLTATATGVAGGQSTYTHTYAYNAIGDITSGPIGSYVYNGSSGSNWANPHAATSINSVTNTYDKDGNNLTDGTLTNTWNYKQQLTNATDGVFSIDYLYDHEGNRVSTDDGTTTTEYPNKYYNDDGTKKTKSIYAGDKLVATIETVSSAVTPFYVHTDHLGGTNVVTDASGVSVNLLDYFPFGSNRINSGSYTSARQYIGEKFDSDTSLNYLNARYYEGNTGRFISQDPSFLSLGDERKTRENTGKGLQEYLMDPQTLNSYSYAGNNPINRTDPTGKAFVIDDAIGFVGGGLIGAGVYALSSAIAGEDISWSGASGAFVTGGIIGWGAVNTPETLGASNAISASIITGMAGGFYGDVTKQGIDIATGKQTGGLNYREIQNTSLITGATNGVLQGVLPEAKIPGVTSGQGNMNAVGQAMRTKAANGTISNISANTAFKSVAGSQAADLYRTSLSGVVDSVKSFISNKPKQ